MAMDPRVQEDYRRALATNINTPVLAYYKARLQEVQDQLVHAGPDAFKQLQGRALELTDLIKVTQSLRE